MNEFLYTVTYKVVGQADDVEYYLATNIQDVEKLVASRYIRRICDWTTKPTSDTKIVLTNNFAFSATNGVMVGITIEKQVYEKL